MPQQDIPWDIDPALTQRGAGPFGHAPAHAPRSADPARYRLGSRLGDAGQVYEAHNARYSGRLVVKLFPFAASLAPAAVGAFTREAGRVADLRHPHIAQVIHAGVFADGTPFVAMERLFGQTLDQRIAGGGALSVSETLALVRGIASALSAAHAAGVIHREVRADNVFIADMAGYEHGFAKLLDFGVSGLTVAARAGGRIVAPGTLRALAPEQGPGAAASYRADERTDQFALGALTYRLVTGAEPFAGHDSGPAFERLNENQTGASPAFVRCAPAVGAVLNRAMSKRPEKRFDSVAIFFRAFEEALTGKSSAPIEKHDAPTVLARVPKPTSTVGAVAEAGASGDADAGVEPPGASSPTLRRTVAPVASLTQQFFVEGDRQEASQWANVAFDQDEPSVESDDRVPKRRGPLIAALMVIGLGVTAWATDLWSPLAWFATRAADTGSTDRTIAPVIAPAIPPVHVAAPVPREPVRSPSFVVPVSRSPDRPGTAISEPRAALLGYAWSPDRRRMVRVQLPPLPIESPPAPDQSPSPPLTNAAPPPQPDPPLFPPTGPADQPAAQPAESVVP